MCGGTLKVQDDIATKPVTLRMLLAEFKCHARNLAAAALCPASKNVLAASRFLGHPLSHMAIHSNTPAIRGRVLLPNSISHELQCNVISVTRSLRRALREKLELAHTIMLQPIHLNTARRFLWPKPSEQAAELIKNAEEPVRVVHCKQPDTFYIQCPTKGCGNIQDEKCLQEVR